MFPVLSAFIPKKKSSIIIYRTIIATCASTSTSSSPTTMFSATGDRKESQPSTSPSSMESQPCLRFEFSEILIATSNFDESLVIGRGGFGKVYKGNIINRSSVDVAAIKRLDSLSTQGATEFWAEVEMLSKLRHSHLVPLFGYCNHEEELVLVYEYMPNGSLEDHLHQLGTRLSWLQRLKICIGAARGLDYLHTGTGIDVGVIHRDVKSLNILLHESWAAKISDFGLSKIGPTNRPSAYVNTLVKGTFGYVDPHYFATGRLTRKSDVYAFGVVLFEVLCRKHPLDNSLEEGLATWAQDSIKEGKLKDIIDSDIRGQISTKCLKGFVRIAERCLHSHPKLRPTMAEVVFSLESALTLQEKINSSLVVGGGQTVFGRVFAMFPFVSNGENSAHGDLSNSKVNSRNADGANNKDATIPILTLKVYNFSDLRKATRNFSADLPIGTFAYGSAYLGWVDKNTFSPSKEGRGVAIAVEKCENYKKWQAVVNVLGRLAHPNLISLLGYCDDAKDRGMQYLVYEYMHQDLDHLLFGDSQNVFAPLSWGTRLMIMIGVARGIAYMHSSLAFMHSSEGPVIHCDIKPSNILVDQNLCAKLGGFELARYDRGDRYVSGVVADGYADPMYIMLDDYDDDFEVKSDIYSFGVVLLATLTGRRALGQPSQPLNLVEWASPSLARRSKLKEIMDPRLEQNYPLNGAFECAALVLRCLAKSLKDRPSSEEVLRSLEKIYANNK